MRVTAIGSTCSSGSDDAAVVQLYADGFEALPLREKTLIWHLYQAALAGRDIFYDQKHRDALEMRGILEQIVTIPQGVDQATLAEVQRYTKLFWINNGPYNNLTARKFVLKTSPEALAAAARPRPSGRDVHHPPTARRSTPLARLQPMFFDPSVDPIVTNKNPGPGKRHPAGEREQPVRQGVSMADLKGFTERYGLNSRLVKRDGRWSRGLQGWRRTARRSPRSSATSKRRIPFAPDSMAKALRALVQWYRTGETPTAIKYDIAWVQDKDSPVDTINGFIEVYMDPRGVKGSWEALVFYVNQEKTAAHQDAGRQRAVVRGPHAVGSEVSQAERAGHRRQRDRRGHGDRRRGPGDADRHQPAQRSEHPREVRQQVGGALERERGVLESRRPGSMRSEFSWSPEEGTAPRSSAELAGELTTDMHEVIGHASGRRPNREGASPQDFHQGVVSRRSRKAAPTWSACTSSPIRSWWSWASSPPPITTPSCAPSTRPTPATRSCSCAASAKARRSRKTTCATAR
jgi:dipeptidyl-peptidase III